MTMLSKYHVPGLAIEDHSIDVPLDWTGHEPGRAFDGETIKLFYRVVTAPEHVHDDLPLLIFLQGGPGGAGPRLNSPTSDGWIEEAIRHFRVILPAARSGVATAVVLGVGRAIGEAMAIIMVAGNVANMPGLFTSVRFLTTAIASEMSYAAYGSLQRQALYSIGLVLFLFIMLINVLLNVFIKKKKED